MAALTLALAVMGYGFLADLKLDVLTVLRTGARGVFWLHDSAYWRQFLKMFHWG